MMGVARRIGNSAAFGFLAVVVFAAGAIFAVPAVGFPLLFAPGALLASVFGPVFEIVARQLEIDGGPELGVGLLLMGALIFWWLLFTIIIAALRHEPTVRADDL